MIAIRPAYPASSMLAEVLEEMGSPDYDPIFLRAHEVDDALQDEPDPNDPDADGSDDDDQDGV